MNAFPTVVYDLGALRKKLPTLAVPTIEKAITELMRLARENETLQSAVRRAEVGEANDIRDCAACRERWAMVALAVAGVTRAEGDGHR